MLAALSRITAALLIVASAAAAQPTTRPSPAAKHVLLIGLDGARADAIRDHAGPAVRSLIDNGTCCWRAKAVKPSVTQVNWASILTGCRPATHGIEMNPTTEAQLDTVKVKVPTLFDLVALNGGSAVGFLGHWKLYPNETKTPGARTLRSSYESRVVGGDAAKYLVAERPTFAFVYIGDLDGIGHREGWMSPAYLAGLLTVDVAVGKLLDALDRAGTRDETAVFLTSDHGGHAKAHGGGTPEDLTIPWIACGPGIERGITIDRELSTIDTAPTIFAVLGMTGRATFDGTPVVEALAAGVATRTTSVTAR